MGSGSNTSPVARAAMLLQSCALRSLNYEQHQIRHPVFKHGQIWLCCRVVGVIFMCSKISDFLSKARGYMCIPRLFIA
jgi:hypothetical protein